MNRSVSVGIVALVVVVSLATLGAPMTILGPGADAYESSRSQQTTSTVQASIQPQSANEPYSIAGSSQDFDRTTFEITVHENGSATWTFQHEQRFDSENESEDREAFEKFAEEFESEETGLYERFTDQAQAMVESGSDQTGREMEATNFERSATVEDQFGTRGIVEMSFTWEGFAATDGDTVEAGDVFQDIYIGPDQSIVIVAGDGLTFDRIEPEEDAQYSGQSIKNADAVRWSGERQFLDRNPRAVFVHEGASGGDDGTGSTVSAIPDGDTTAWYLAVGAIVVLAVGGGALWYRGRETTTDGATGPAAGAVAQPNGAATDTADSNPAPAAADVDEAPASSADSEPVPDEELLTDEDRVVRLIRENGGRMKQVNIVEETGWSKSKVSMLLSDMEDEGTISKLRVGRENIISLEGFEPEATKSPFDE